jgi:hypothetical protein
VRVWTFPLVALAVMLGSYSDEPTDRQPTEQQMQIAFRDSLAAEVQGVLDFVAETGGPEALAKIYAAGTDRFEVRDFHKLDCQRAAARDYRCDFTVEIGVVTGIMQRRLSGRFTNGPSGLRFVSES